MVDVTLRADLTITIEPGDDNWAYAVTVTYDSEQVTEYGSNFEPWGRAGRKILGNILVTRIDAYDDRERVGRFLEEAFAARESELKTTLGVE